MDIYLPDPQCCFDMYWFHSHVVLLLSEYDTLNWGAWETKVTKCVPSDKQKHLLSYFAKADSISLASAMKQCMTTFNEDAIEIFQRKNIAYQYHVADSVTRYFNREVG